MIERDCYKCGSKVERSTPRGRAVCDACRVPHRGTGKPRPQKHLVCTACGEPFKTTSGNRVCPSCRHGDRKHPCADCGVAVDARAERCMDCWGRQHAGPAATNWKGGRTRHRLHGYVLVRAPDHPRCRSNGYVPEHTLVMEAMLGRYLLPGENVHHRNGQRDDNRPENLELWVRSQPAGQRAVDLLAWARQIEATYGPLATVIAPDG